MASLADDSGRRFYKYLTRATGRIVLENGTLRWSSPLAFNDPYDNQFDLHIDIDPTEAKRRTMQKLWDVYSGAVVAPIGNEAGVALALLRASQLRLSRDQFNEQFEPTIDAGLAAGDRYLAEFHQNVRRLAARHKLLCLSATATSTLMWAYYCEGHQGLVLRFRTPEGVDSPWLAGKPIQYKKHMPRLFDVESLSDLMSGRSSLAFEVALTNLVFTKSQEWAHEREWRIFSGEGRTPQAQFEDIPFNALELDGVIVGCRMPAEDRTELSSLVRRLYPHAQVLQVVTRQREFGLDVEPL